MHIVLTGGGTAGHVNPAIAIAQIVRQRIPDAVISFVGTPHGMENRLVSREGYPMYHVNVRGLSRSLSPKNIYAAYLAWSSPRVARKLLRSLSPDVVIGTGGYVSWPVLKAAALEGIPCAVHESNAVPGLTVRKLSNYVDRVFLNFGETAACFDADVKTVTVGNPLRDGFRRANRAAVRASLGLSDSDRLILSFGGSLGAVALNNACLALMRDYVASNPAVHMIHGCGERNYDICKKAFDEAFPGGNPRLSLLAYIQNVPELMQAADIVISRAGAMTVSEIALAGVASVLVPSPNVTGDHQTKNARLLADANAAVLAEESNNLNALLTERVRDLLENEHYRRTVSARARDFARPDAADLIFDQILDLVENGRKSPSSGTPDHKN